MKQIVRSADAPAPVGPYSQAVICNDLVFTAGQIALDPATSKILPADIGQQTRQCLTNLRAVLQAAGTDLAHVLKTTVFLKNMDDFSAMNEVYAEFFQSSPPARSAVEVSRLPKDVLVEIECVAALP